MGLSVSFSEFFALFVSFVVYSSRNFSDAVTVRRPKANRVPVNNSGSRQRFRPCRPADNHRIHSWN
jgi:hypothetical protein